MTMDAQRQAELQANAVERALGRVRSALSGEEQVAFRVAADALRAKPSESSMVQRIEAPKSSEQSLMEENERLRTALMKIRGAATRPTFARAACEGIVLVVNLALDGPPDPERGRETRRETEAAEADDARLDAIEGENNYREIIDR